MATDANPLPSAMRRRRRNKLFLPSAKASASVSEDAAFDDSTSTLDMIQPPSYSRNAALHDSSETLHSSLSSLNSNNSRWAATDDLEDADSTKSFPPRPPCRVPSRRLSSNEEQEAAPAASRRGDRSCVILATSSSNGCHHQHDESSSNTSASSYRRSPSSQNLSD